MASHWPPRTSFHYKGWVNLRFKMHLALNVFQNYIWLICCGFITGSHWILIYWSHLASEEGWTCSHDCLSSLRLLSTLVEFSLLRKLIYDATELLCLLRNVISTSWCCGALCLLLLFPYDPLESAIKFWSCGHFDSTHHELSQVTPSDYDLLPVQPGQDQLGIGVCICMQYMSHAFVNENLCIILPIVFLCIIMVWSCTWIIRDFTPRV